MIFIFMKTDGTENVLNYIEFNYIYSLRIFCSYLQHILDEAVYLS